MDFIGFFFFNNEKFFQCNLLNPKFYNMKVYRFFFFSFQVQVIYTFCMKRSEGNITT